MDSIPSILSLQSNSAICLFYCFSMRSLHSRPCPFSWSWEIPHRLSSAGAFRDHIRGSGQTSPINGYLIHSHRYQSSKPTTIFWLLQAFIEEQLYVIRKLRLFVAFIHLDHDGCSVTVTKFVTRLHPQGCIISRLVCSFPNHGNSVIATCSVLIGIQDSTQSKVEPLLFWMPIIHLATIQCARLPGFLCAWRFVVWYSIWVKWCFGHTPIYNNVSFFSIWTGPFISSPLVGQWFVIT